VRELVEVLNRDPRRRPGHTSVLSRVRLDAATDLVLGQQGLTLESVPAVGQVVRLCGNGNLSTGGTATDVTEQVHPSNARVAELAAQFLALDVAGIDFLCEDISRPVAEQGGAIVEVNAAPGLRMHLAPTAGQPRDVAGPIVDMLYPAGKSARIPIVAVTGTNGKTTVTRLVAHMFETARKVVGMTTTEGTYIAGERIIRGDCSGPKSARTVLLHPRVEVAVLETARGGILREGLGFDWCSVGVVTNVSADHLGLRGIRSVEDLARVKQVVIENVHRDGVGVLNAEDPLVAEMAAVCSGRVVYFGLDPCSAVMAAHLASGGDGVFVEDGAVVLARDGLHTALVELERVPCTAGGRVRFQVQNVLAAAAAGWAAGLNPALLARALATFHADTLTVPARFNVSDVQDIQLVIDYGHNAAAMRALSEAVLALGRRRTVLLLGLPGDRRDEDLRATIQASLACADEYVLYDQTNRRGRAPGAVPELLRAAVPGEKPAVCAPSQEAGIRAAWARVRPGERLVVIADEVDEALALVQELAAATLHDSLCLWPISREPAPVAAA
jgi:cyanophycin synthetase